MAEPLTMLRRDRSTLLSSLLGKPLDVPPLPERLDRRSEMRAEMARVGLEFEFFDAIKVQDKGMFQRLGSHGCFLGHRQLLNEAASQNSGIFIIQDDCVFIVDRVSIPDCDIFYGGFEASDPSDPHHSDIIGAHCMAFSPLAARLASEYLEDYLKLGFSPDPQAAQESSYNPNVRPPIDGAMVWFRRRHPELRTVFNKIALQRSSRSDVTPGRFDTVPIVRVLLSMADVFEPAPYCPG